jgi:hypothetical protein
LRKPIDALLDARGVRRCQQEKAGGDATCASGDLGCHARPVGVWPVEAAPSQQLPSPARAPLCSDRAARNLESATLAEPTGVLHVSRAEVGTRDATGTNCETPRHPLATGKLRKVLGAAGRPGQRTRSRHRSGSVRDIAAMPAGVVGQQQPDSRQRAATSHGGARRRAVSARTLGARRIAARGRPRPEQLEVAGRATDTHADLGS